MWRSDPKPPLPAKITKKVSVRNKKCEFISLTPSSRFCHVQYMLGGRQHSKEHESQTPPTRHHWEYKTI